MEKIYPKNDLLFADMMTNTQGIYKFKKVKQGTEAYNKVQIFFKALLDENSGKFEELPNDVIELNLAR